MFTTLYPGFELLGEKGEAVAVVWHLDIGLMSSEYRRLKDMENKQTEKMSAVMHRYQKSSSLINWSHVLILLVVLSRAVARCDESYGRLTTSFKM